jgi:nucleotide-binding universal stress UspA family protein
MTRVLVAVDGTDASVKAARVAHSLFGEPAEYLAINVLDPTTSGSEAAMSAWWTPGYPMTWGLTWPYEVTDDGEPVPATTAAADVARETAAEAGLPVERAAGELGDPADAILEAAHSHHADVIVVGWHERGWFSRLLAPSVAKDVLKHSDVPVLVVR